VLRPELLLWDEVMLSETLISPATIADLEAMSGLLRSARLVPIDDMAQFVDQYAVAAAAERSSVWAGIRGTVRASFSAPSRF
jgi:hypothetical protein